MAWCRERRAERIEFRVHRASAVAEALIRARADWEHIVAVDLPDGVFRGRVTRWSTARGHDTMTIEVTDFARESLVPCRPLPQVPHPAL